MELALILVTCLTLFLKLCLRLEICQRRILFTRGHSCSKDRRCMHMGMKTTMPIFTLCKTELGPKELSELESEK